MDPFLALLTNERLERIWFAAHDGFEITGDGRGLLETRQEVQHDHNEDEGGVQSFASFAEKEAEQVR